MRTIVKSKIASQVEDLAFSYFDLESEEVMEVEEGDAAAIATAAVKLQCSPELVAALADLVAFAAGEMHADLVDIWKRLDTLEGK